MNVNLIGKKEIHSAKTGKDFTMCYVVYDDAETSGQACKEIVLSGHDIPDKLVGQVVSVTVGLDGRVQSLEEA